MALPSTHRFFILPWPFAPGPPPRHCLVPPSPSSTSAVPSPGRLPGPQPQLSAPGQGAPARPGRHWACSEAAAGAGLLRRRSHSVAGGRAAAAGAPAPGVGVAGSFPPSTPPSWRAAAGAGAGAASGGEPAPGPAEPCPEPGAPCGAAPGEEPRRLGRVPHTATAPAPAGLHGRARVWGTGRERQRPGRGCGGWGGCGCSSRGGRGTPSSVRCGRPGQGPHCGALGVGRRPERCVQVGGRRERGLRAQAQLLCARSEGLAPWFSPDLGPSVRGGLGKPRSGEVSSEKVEDGALLSALSSR